MRKIPERFYVDIKEFEGEDVDIKVKKRIQTSHLLKPGAVVEVSGIDEKIEIDHVLPVYEKVIYDYRGIMKTDTGAKYIYFYHSAIIQHEG